MTAVSLIPWRPGDPVRARNLEFVENLLANDGYPIVRGELDEETPWSKGLAVAAGLAHTDANVLIIHDADVVCDGIAEAVDRVERGVSSWAIPHRTVIRLNQEATADVLNGGSFAKRNVTRRPYLGIIGGGIVIIKRELYERAPFDRRFIGWGHEDVAAGITWRCLAGTPWRGTADLWHLWHPPQAKITEAIGSRESKQLLDRYQRASLDPDAMTALIAEGRLGL